MDEDKIIIDTTLRSRIHAMSLDELYKYVWDTYYKLKDYEKNSKH